MATKEGYSFANLKEDYHYSLIEYQGSNLTHWSFNIDEEEDKRIKANFICGNPVLIADGDIENKGDRLTIYKDMLGDKLVVLKCKEIENLLPLEVLKELVEPTFQEHGKDINSLNYDDYSKPDIGLGVYLDKLLSADGGEAKFSEKSGTIKNKVKICNDAINIMNDHDFNWALTAELTELCKKIFGHILEHNSNTHDERQGL